YEGRRRALIRRGRTNRGRACAVQVEAGWANPRALVEFALGLDVVGVVAVDGERRRVAAAAASDAVRIRAAQCGVQDHVTQGVGGPEPVRAGAAAGGPG